MKPKNFPEKKNQRRAKALQNLQAQVIRNDSKNSKRQAARMEEMAILEASIVLSRREQRSKKNRASFVRPTPKKIANGI